MLYNYYLIERTLSFQSRHVRFTLNCLNILTSNMGTECCIITIQTDYEYFMCEGVNAYKHVCLCVCLCMSLCVPVCVAWCANNHK